MDKAGSKAQQMMAHGIQIPGIPEQNTGEKYENLPFSTGMCMFIVVKYYENS